MRKIFAFCFLTIFLCFCIVGCGSTTKKNEETEEIDVLNERQKEILRGVGLSTNYEDLNFTQKEAIMSIEKMLVYLDNKYPNKTFEYTGYVMGSSLEKKNLSVKTTTTKGHTENCKVYADNSTSFHDDCANVFVKDEYQDLILNYSNSILKCDNCIKVWSNITSVKNYSIDNIIFEDNISSLSLIFINNKTINLNQYNSFLNELEVLLKEHKLYGKYRIFLSNDEDFQLVTSYNYADYIKKSIESKDLMISR